MLPLRSKGNSEDASESLNKMKPVFQNNSNLKNSHGKSKKLPDSILEEDAMSGDDTYVN